MKLAEGSGFRTRMTFPGILPWLPDVGGMPPDAVAELLRPERTSSFRPVPADTY